jgi:hypothetical protein
MYHCDTGFFKNYKNNFKHYPNTFVINYLVTRIFKKERKKKKEDLLIFQGWKCLGLR